MVAGGRERVKVPDRAGRSARTAASRRSVKARGDSPSRATRGWPKRTQVGPTMGPPCPGRQHIPEPVDPNRQDGHAGVHRDEPDARLELGHLAGSAAGSLGEDHDAPAVGEQALDGTDGLGAPADPPEGHSREPRHEQAIRPPLEPVVVGRRDGEAVSTVAAERPSENRDIEMALVVRADQQRARQADEPLRAFDPRARRPAARGTARRRGGRPRAQRRRRVRAASQLMSRAPRRRRCAAPSR